MLSAVSPHDLPVPLTGSPRISPQPRRPFRQTDSLMRGINRNSRGQLPYDSESGIERCSYRRGCGVTTKLGGRARAEVVVQRNGGLAFSPGLDHPRRLHGDVLSSQTRCPLVGCVVVSRRRELPSTEPMVPNTAPTPRARSPATSALVASLVGRGSTGNANTKSR